MNSPRFYVSKDIQKRGILRLGTLSVPYQKIQKVFGAPCLSEAAGDAFDGSESVAWTIKFETGHVAEITDINSFGQKTDYKTCTDWAIFGHDDSVFNLLKNMLR